MASMKDVAEKAGVSIATVSRVLANKPNVRPEVREQVMRVVQELGYRPNRVASSLRKQTSGVIGLLVSDIRNPFFTDIARAIEDIAHQRHMSVFLCNTDEDPEKEEQYLYTLLDENVAGIILSPTPSPAKHYQHIMQSSTPIVMIDRRVAGYPTDCVLSDNIQSAYEITSHLIEQGCRRIGAVMGLSGSTTGRERMNGYLESLREHQLEAFGEFVEPHEAAAEVLVSEWLKAKNSPDAILAGNSRINIGALNAIKEAGLSIPQDIRLAGFDDPVWMRHVGEGITVISQPTYEMGRSAAELLFQRIDDVNRPVREVILKGELIIRGSTQGRNRS